MTTPTRWPLAEAQGKARELVALLEPFCERIVVAGSIRRRAPDVGDVELLCLSKGVTSKDLLGAQVPGQTPEVAGQMTGEPLLWEPICAALNCPLHPKLPAESPSRRRAPIKTAAAPPARGRRSKLEVANERSQNLLVSRGVRG